MKNLVSLICLGVLACAMFGQQVDGSFFLPSQPSGTFVSLLNMVNNLEQRVEVVERRGCLTGNFRADVCDVNTITDGCVLDFITTGELTNLNHTVDFDVPFDKPPEVVAGLSGFFAAFDKNCTVNATDVTTSGFQLHLTLGGVLPFRVDIAWMACDKRRLLP